MVSGILYSCYFKDTWTTCIWHGQLFLETQSTLGHSMLLSGHTLDIYWRQLLNSSAQIFLYFILRNLKLYIFLVTTYYYCSTTNLLFYCIKKKFFPYNLNLRQLENKLCPFHLHTLQLGKKVCPIVRLANCIDFLVNTHYLTG
jgi:hypothetical protein